MLTFTLGSHFDGIAGFPLAATRAGITPVWATEIEPFPILVSKHHFPTMLHFGSITEVSGYKLPLVDIITFGSPCQDLSVAGKREGLGGERSGLFMEAIRTIREMRIATNGNYPRYAVWENVPGAFSSNKGGDFRAVLEAFTETEIPMPASGKWAEAGMVRGNGREIAWRTLDAQYWGVPQRRKRIFLVADFRGERAGEILFEPEGMSGDTQESGEAREGIAEGAGNGTKVSVPLMLENHYQPFVVHDKQVVLADQGGSKMSVSYDIAPTLRAQEHGHQPLVFGPGGSHDITHALRSQPSKADKPSSTTYVIQSATMGGEKKQNGLGVMDGPCYTLDTRADHAICYPEPVNTLLAKANMSHRDDTDNVVVERGYVVRRLTPTEYERLMGFPDGWTDIEGASDTARYKALGNSVAIPCVEWIMGRVLS